MTPPLVPAPDLTPAALAVAASLLLVNAAISWGFRLGLERRLLVVSLRMVVQLAIAGVALATILAQSSPVWTVAMALVMAAAAGHEVVARLVRRPRGGILPYAAGTLSLLAIGALFSILATAQLIGAEPWYAPRYLLPVLGMVLGNALTGATLVLDAVIGAAHRERAALEARLALGESRYVAFEGVLRRGIGTGLTPILNAMAVAGVVSLPGMMTGQILAGADPLQAAKYQMMILFLIAAATALTVLVAGVAAVRLLTDERHRLRLDRLQPADPHTASGT